MGKQSASTAADAAGLLQGPGGPRLYLDLHLAFGGDLQRMPVVHRLLAENVLRQQEPAARARTIADFRGWLERGESEAEITFLPSRILMHDTTCGPALVDIAAMRDAVALVGGDPALLNPDIPVATSTDHSVAVDLAGAPGALAHNMARELQRNHERYSFMKWASRTVSGFTVFPPGSGIMHTINMERLATVVRTQVLDGQAWAVPDTLVGTDSHTPMINALGVLGWGVGGIEAEGAMFGVPISLRIPKVIGVRLTGALPQGVWATDLALTVTEVLRGRGMDSEFVEFFGPGVSALTVGQRASVANMAPEYGATTGLFPIDRHTLDYLRATGRDEEHMQLVEAYAKAQGLWSDPEAKPRYTEVVDIDLSSISTSLAGPRRPQDRVAPSRMAALLQPILAGASPGAAGEPPADAVAIAAITSCTNTTDIALLLAAGLVARKARALGLTVPSWVKTSLTPGSPASEARLRRAGVLEDLEAMGFAIAGYGCATCIGNSGPLDAQVLEAVRSHGLKPIAVLSGNRNFPGRVHALIDNAFLASPPLVVAFAIAGRAALDITADVIGASAEGRPVRLADLWPTQQEVEDLVLRAHRPGGIDEAYDAAETSSAWRALAAADSSRFPWDSLSTYLRPPPFVRFQPPAAGGALSAKVLAVFGDDMTTDHISPAGSIPAASEAAAYLIGAGADPEDLNVYASRRGNWEVMVRGLFTNRTAINSLAADLQPGFTVVGDEAMPIWRAARVHADQGTPTVIVAGERYGAGSSRDWAAKGVQLLGVRAVLANSFERIHRSNLIGMGVLPLQLPQGWRPQTLELGPHDMVAVGWDLPSLHPRESIAVTITRPNGEVLSGMATALVDTAAEIRLIQAGGMIPLVLERTLRLGAQA